MIVDIPGVAASTNETYNCTQLISGRYIVLHRPSNPQTQVALGANEIEVWALA